MTLADDVLTLTEDDVRGDWPAVRLRRVAAVVMPAACRKAFFGSTAYYATAPMAVGGVYVFVGPGRQVEVRPVANRRASLAVSSQGVVYLGLGPGADRVKAVRTVEAVPGRVFADLGEGVDVLGVEVFL